MADSNSAPLKRQRPDYSAESDAADDNNKRQKPSYNQIISFLDEDTEEPNQDFSSLLTSLQDELSSDLAAGNVDSSAAAAAVETTTVEDYPCSSSSSSSSNFEVKDEEDEKERVIRHLLEASDDELGIPTAVEGDGGDFFTAVDSVEGYSNWNGLWEFEDANANYYTMLQSELFM
ncbi:hypothetical protein LINGRAHAP2_LOCUS35046 [Linum grandiflorum]